MLQFHAGDQQHRVLDRIERSGRAVQKRGQRNIQLFVLLDRLLQQGAKIFAIRTPHVGVEREFAGQILPGCGIELPAVQGLHGQAPRQGPRRRLRVEVARHCP